MDRQQTARRGMLVALIVLGVLVVDQLIKIWVKTNMTLHEQIEILSWFKIVFIENNGMAYGMEIGSKLVLSLFRVVAISILGYYMVGLVKRQSRWGYLVCLSMILAGAVGNMLDSMFYGLIFNASSEFYTSYFVPFGTGYAPFMMGKVVDMFYFPLIVTSYPEWFPFNAGEEFIFFSPVFNFADAAISVGVVMLLLFFRNEISEISLKSKCERKNEDSD
jgi:signal peptidase II